MLESKVLEWLKPILAHLKICGYKYKDGRIVRRVKKRKKDTEKGSKTKHSDNNDIIDECFNLNTDSTFYKK